MNSQNNPISPVDLNLASADELAASLPGIGARIASRIVERRASVGPFRAIEDLASVAGVGSKRALALANRISFSTTPPGVMASATGPTVLSMGPARGDWHWDDPMGTGKPSGTLRPAPIAAEASGTSSQTARKSEAPAPSMFQNDPPPVDAHAATVFITPPADDRDRSSFASSPPAVVAVEPSESHPRRHARWVAAAFVAACMVTGAALSARRAVGDHRGGAITVPSARAGTARTERHEPAAWAAPLAEVASDVATARREIEELREQQRQSGANSASRASLEQVARRVDQHAREMSRMQRHIGQLRDYTGVTATSAHRDISTVQDRIRVALDQLDAARMHVSVP